MVDLRHGGPLLHEAHPSLPPAPLAAVRCLGPPPGNPLMPRLAGLHLPILCPGSDPGVGGHAPAWAVWAGCLDAQVCLTKGPSLAQRWPRLHTFIMFSVGTVTEPWDPLSCLIPLWPPALTMGEGQAFCSREQLVGRRPHSGGTSEGGGSVPYGWQGKLLTILAAADLC